MNSLGKYLRERRVAKGLSLRELADKSGISHTEIHRIETGKREYPTIRILMVLSKTLDLPDDEILRYAGYKSKDGEDVTAMERSFPALKTQKQQETAQRFIDGLARNHDLQDSEYDDLIDQVEMFLQFAKSKRNSKKTKI